MVILFNCIYNIRLSYCAGSRTLDLMNREKQKCSVRGPYGIRSTFEVYFLFIFVSPSINSDQENNVFTYT